MWDAAIEMQQSFRMQVQSMESLLRHGSLWAKVSIYINICMRIVIDRDEQTMGDHKRVRIL